MLVSILVSLLYTVEGPKPREWWCRPQWAGLPTSMDVIKKISYGHALRPVSQVILESVKLIVNTKQGEQMWI